MQIRQILVTQMILCTTAAFITGAQAMEDDVMNHYTRVGGRTIPHTVTPGREIDHEGMVIFFDPRLPNNQQLSLRPRERIISYTCPAIPGIRGLEKPRPMGGSLKYLTQESDPMRPTATRIELIRVSSNLGLPVLAGPYRQCGIRPISSKIENDQKIDTKQLICHRGHDDGLINNIEFKEFMYHIPHSFAFSKGCLTRENPKTAAVSPCFTFSCWFLPIRQGQEIFSWSYPAPEPELKGQKKRMAIGMDPANKAAHRVFLKLPIVETKDIPAVTKPASTTKTITVDEKYKATTTVKGIVIIPNRKACNSKVYADFNATSAAEMKKLSLNLNQIRLAQQGGLPGVKVTQAVWMASRKNGKEKPCGEKFFCVKTITKNKVRKVPKKIVENKTVVVTPARKDAIKTLKEDLKFSSEFATSATSWVHLQLFVDANKKSMKVHVDGKDILTVSNSAHIISLNELCSLQIGDSRFPAQGLIADINLANGQKLNPPAFCNITSQGILTPKNFTGPFGPNGFQLRGGPALDLVTRNVPDTSPNKTQWKAQWEANGSVSFPLKSPTTSVTPLVAQPQPAAAKPVVAPVVKPAIPAKSAAVVTPPAAKPAAAKAVVAPTAKPVTPAPAAQPQSAIAKPVTSPSAATKPAPAKTL